MKFKTDVALKEAGAYREGQQFQKWRTRWIAGCIIPALLIAPFIVPIFMMFVVWGNGFGGRLDWNSRIIAVQYFFMDMGNIFLGKMNFFNFIVKYYGFYLNPQNHIQAYFPFYMLLLAWIFMPIMVICIGLKGNPYRETPNVYGDSRWATEKDIADMERRDLVGFNKNLFLIGRFKEKGKRFKRRFILFGKKIPIPSRLLRMGETLSLLLLAPPGTGKSVGFIVPATVTMDHCSLFLHDQKPELFDMTSGHRSKIGPVFQLKWSAQDAPEGEWINDDQLNLISPELLELDENGEIVRNEDGFYKTKPLFYPCWNPLSPKSMPAPGDRRDTYISRLVSVLCPDPKGGDKFWASKARDGLIGMLQYLVAKVDYANHPLIKGGWDGIPEAWHGHEASFPMLIDWLAYAQLKYEDGSDDPMRQMFKQCVEDARKMDETFSRVIKQRVLNRAINELTNLMNTPDRTRGSIMQTADEALSPFKNSAVRQRTMTSDFAFYELRGMPTQEAKEREMARVHEANLQGKVYKPRYAKEEYRPVTIYISIPLEDAKTFASLTGIFVDSANAYLVANGPNSVDDQGNQNGPGYFGFLLDEAPQLPKLDTITNGPAVGRSKKVFYVIVGQDFGQFEEKYSKQEVQTLQTNTAIKLVLAQNNIETAKQISAIVGKMTVVKHSYSPKSSSGAAKGLSGTLAEITQGLGGPKLQTSESLEGVDFITPSKIMAMPEGDHIAIVQNYAERPLLLETPRFFEEPSIKPKVYNLRDFTGPKPCMPMPGWAMEEAQARFYRMHAQEEAEAARRARLNDPRVVIVVSPQDLASMKSGENEMGVMDVETEWHFCPVEIESDQMDIKDPLDDSTVSTEYGEQGIDIINGSRIIIFDRNTLDIFNEWLDEAGQERIPEEMAIFLTERASTAGELEMESLYALGFHGSSRLDYPDNADQVIPHHAALWVVQIMGQILRVEAARRLFDQPD